MSSRIDACVALLGELGVALAPGLAPGELADVEQRYGFAFGPDHRELLTRALPTGDRWANWRDDPEVDLRKRLAWPIEGALFDVANRSFWAGSWGRRPDDDGAALVHARAHLESWPVLVPIYAHRYLPAAPSSPGAPVFSVHQTDVIVYGGDLLDYLRREFGPRPSGIDYEPVTVDVPPWSQLALAVPGAEL